MPNIMLGNWTDHIQEEKQTLSTNHSVASDMVGTMHEGEVQGDGKT